VILFGPDVSGQNRAFSDLDDREFCYSFLYILELFCFGLFPDLLNDLFYDDVFLVILVLFSFLNSF